jgi:hypothetical protein
MNLKKWLIGSAAVFIMLMAMEYLVHSVILKTAYEQTSQLWRQPERQQMMFGWRLLGYAFFALLFGFIYTHGYQRKGAIGQGLRYGLYAGLLVFLPYNLVLYTMLPLPANVVFAWMAFGVIESLLAGLIFSLFYRDPKKVAEA